MKIFVFGFGPYHRRKKNASQEVIKRLQKRRGMTTQIFTVGKDKEKIARKIRKEKPDVILGLGEASKINQVKIEQQARNTFKRRKEARARKINPDGKQIEKMTFSKPADKRIKISKNAGWFVCNYAMYSVLPYAKEHKISFAFMHIPHDYNIDQAVELVELQLDKMTK